MVRSEGFRTTLGAITLLLSGCGMLVGAEFDDLRGRDPNASSVNDDGGGGSTTKDEGGPTSPPKTTDGGSKSSGDSGGGSSSGGSGRCEGTAPNCGSFIESSTCGAIRGCAWSTPRCLVVNDCASKTTSQACTATPGCATDFATSTCKPKAGYCFGTNEVECEAKDGCGFSGGCTGTATACTALSNEGTCITQKGCVWQ